MHHFFQTWAHTPRSQTSGGGGATGPGRKFKPFENLRLIILREGTVRELKRAAAEGLADIKIDALYALLEDGVYFSVETKVGRQKGRYLTY